MTLTWRLAAYGLAALAASGLLLGAYLSIRGAYQAKGRLAASELALEASRERYDGYREASERALAAWAARDAADRARDASLAASLDQIRAQVEATRLAASKFKPTREVTDASGHAVLSIDPDWWLCVSATGSGDPADAAACETRAGAGPVRH